MPVTRFLYKICVLTEQRKLHEVLYLCSNRAEILVAQDTKGWCQSFHTTFDLCTLVQNTVMNEIQSTLHFRSQAGTQVNFSTDILDLKQNIRLSYCLKKLLTSLESHHDRNATFRSYQVVILRILSSAWLLRSMWRESGT